MHARSSAIIGAGVILSFLGIVTVLGYGRSLERRAAGGPAAAAWVATRDIPAGTSGTEAAAAMRRLRVPRSARPRTAIASPEEVRGRIAVRPIAAGEVVTASQFGLASAPPASGLPVPPGRNAVSLNLPAPQGVAHYVQPGDLVNVYVTFKDARVADARGQAPGAVTKLLLSNVQVLANQLAQRAPGAGPASGGGEVVLTLALTPAEAEKLVLAKETGSVWLGLVHPGDAPASTSGQTPSTVLR